MSSAPAQQVAPASTATRAQALFEQDYGAILKRTDRMFAWLMLFQWIAAIVAATVISPRAWQGLVSSVHIHVWAAILLGGLIAAAPIALAILYPGRTITRHVVAVGQMLTSALLIHLLGGRIETHFHIFGSLAFLAFYRDWRVLASATVVVALDHMLRGWLWPQSVYGVAGNAEWRWLEHAGWVVFEDAFLMLSCAQGIREMRAIALRQAEIETKNVELAESTRQAQAAAEAKGQFLANMSHEIRTPLNGVVGMTELLLQTPLSAKQAKYAGLIRSSADTLLCLINDVLDFSKIEAGKFEIEDVDFDLRTLIEEATELLSPRAASKGLELLCRASPGVPSWVRGDPARLRQILLNLGANAVKFTERGEVVISASPVAGGEYGAIRFSVTDTGIGIPATHLGRLFQKFSQIDDSNTRKHGGTGLGLAISKQLVELMGGQIGVESREGVGSTFWFEVPLKPGAAPAPASADAGRLKGMRVLIVDDNSTNLEILSEQCSGWGFHVTTVQDPAEAMRIVTAPDAPAFDLAILDIQMPGISGDQLARMFRHSTNTTRLPLLALSSIDDFTGMEGASHFNARLSKPVRQSDLFNTILRILNRMPGNTPRSTPASGAPAPKPEGLSIRVVLAEDNLVNQLVAAEILRSAGIECVVTHNGREAVEAVKGGGFQLILMDCQMPEMDGFEATREIRRLEANGPTGPSNPAHIPIIALTANAIKGDRERCLAAGMDGYVSKPIEASTLLKSIKELVQSDPRSTQAPSSAPELPPIAYDDLLRRCMGNVDTVNAVLQALITEFRARLVELESAVTGGSAAELARIAHALKGAAANASAESVRALAAEIEQSAREGDPSHAAKLLEPIRSAINECTNYAQHTRSAPRHEAAKETDARSHR